MYSSSNVSYLASRSRQLALANAPWNVKKEEHYDDTVSVKDVSMLEEETAKTETWQNQVIWRNQIHEEVFGLEAEAKTRDYLIRLLRVSCHVHPEKLANELKGDRKQLEALNERRRLSSEAMTAVFSYRRTY